MDVLLKAKEGMEDGIEVQLTLVDEAGVHLELHACGLAAEAAPVAAVWRGRGSSLCCDGSRSECLLRGIPPTL